MTDFYFELKVAASADLQEILVAVLSEKNFDGFSQTDENLVAYSESEMISENELAEIFDSFEIKKTDWQLNKLRNKNWNEEWEKNFEPVVIDDAIYVRALFHPEKKEVKHTITIQPKMSFGTGHHSTTKLVLSEMLQLDFKNKTVLDMGCGTAVLAIYAEMVGAKKIVAIDNDNWAVENAQENCAMNHCTKIEVKLGDEKLLNEYEKYDVIVSNITKNFNIANLPLYKNLLQKNGSILLSGFYETDAADFKKSALKLGGLHLQHQTTEKKWSMLNFKKENSF